MLFWLCKAGWSLQASCWGRLLPYYANFEVHTYYILFIIIYNNMLSLISLATIIASEKPNTVIALAWLLCFSAHFFETLANMPSLLSLVSFHRPEQAPPTMFQNQLCWRFCSHEAESEDCVVVTLQLYGSPDGLFVDTVLKYGHCAFLRELKICLIIKTSETFSNVGPLNSCCCLKTTFSVAVSMWYFDIDTLALNTLESAKRSTENHRNLWIG